MSKIETKIKSKYLDISDKELRLGTTKLLPKNHEIPDEFKYGSKWNKLFSDIFFYGLTEIDIIPKEGIDTNAALKCIKAHMISWEPKHEVKEAGVAYMMSILFEDASWTVMPKT